MRQQLIQMLRKKMLAVVTRLYKAVTRHPLHTSLALLVLALLLTALLLPTTVLPPHTPNTSSTSANTATTTAQPEPQVIYVSACELFASQRQA